MDGSRDPILLSKQMIRYYFYHEFNKQGGVSDERKYRQKAYTRNRVCDSNCSGTLGGRSWNSVRDPCYEDRMTLEHRKGENSRDIGVIKRYLCIRLSLKKLPHIDWQQNVL